MGKRLQAFRLSLGRIFRISVAGAVLARRTSRVVARQIERGMSMMAVALLAQGFGCMLLVAALWGLGFDLLLVGWGVLVAAGIVFSVDYYYRFFADMDRVAHVRRWLRVELALSLATGLVWGGAGALFPCILPGVLPGEVTASAVIGVVLASWPFYALWLPGLFWFTLLSLLPTAASILLNNFSASEGLVSLFFLAVWCLILYSGRRLNDVILTSILTESENRVLLERLRLERKEAEAARRAAEEGSARRQAFFRAANHDLRQPLQAMGIYLQVLRRAATPAMEPAVRQLSTCATSISGLVGQILEVSRINADTFEIRRTRVSVPEYFADLAREYVPIAESRGGRFLVRPADITIDIDKALFGRVIRNLVNNAYKFSDKNEPVVVLSARRRPGGKVQVLVHDNGPGIPAGERERIYEPFFRGSNLASDGYGLGLSIVRGICERMGMGISVVSSIGRGTVFRLTLGEAASAEPAGVVSRAMSDPSDAAPARLDLSVLYLEDNTVVSESVRTLLASWGARVRAAPFLDDALLAEMRSFKPDVVLADFALGEGVPNGIESVLAVSHFLERPVPAVLLTAVPEDMVEAEWRRTLPTRPLVEMPEILRKPVEPGELWSALRAAADLGGPGATES